MLNIERHKYEILKAGGVSAFSYTNGKIQKCMKTKCSECRFGNGRGKCNSLKTKWLCAENDEPDWERDIDWEKVPTDTKVEIRDDASAGWVGGLYFSVYLPNARNGKYWVFSDGSRKRNAGNMTSWKYCKLANPEDVQRYKKRG